MNMEEIDKQILTAGLHGTTQCGKHEGRMTQPWLGCTECCMIVVNFINDLYNLESRRKICDELTKESEKLGMYDNEP